MTGATFWPHFRMEARVGCEAHADKLERRGTCIGCWVFLTMSVLLSPAVSAQAERRAHRHRQDEQGESFRARARSHHLPRLG